ncbi:MAG: MBL fold metallo-hydrolase, partial [Treponema sp.]|nr:MBL fold metallo-hydrolase [Treponema sp.]
DQEPFRNLFPTDPADPDYNEEVAREGEYAAAEENEKMLRFFHNADILIHDAQYTETEYAAKIGWGHASHEQAVDNALKAGAKKLVLTHHDPARTDEQLEKLEKICRAGSRDKGLEIIMAREGISLEA